MRWVFWILGLFALAVAAALEVDVAAQADLFIGLADHGAIVQQHFLALRREALHAAIDVQQLGLAIERAQRVGKGLQANAILRRLEQGGLQRAHALLLPLALAPVVVGNDDFTGARDHHLVALADHQNGGGAPALRRWRIR